MMMVQALFSKMFLGSRRCLGIRMVVAAAVIVGVLVCPVGLWASNDLVLAGRICNGALTPSSANAAVVSGSGAAHYGATRPRSSAIGDYANLDHLPQATRVAIADRFQYLVGIAQRLEAVVGEAGQPGGVFDLQIDFADLALRAQLDVLRAQAERGLRPGERLSAQDQERILSRIDASGHVGTLVWMRGVYERRLNELNEIVAYFRDRCAAEIAAGTLNPPIDSTTGAPVLVVVAALKDSKVQKKILARSLPVIRRVVELRLTLVQAALNELQAFLNRLVAQPHISLAQFGDLALSYPKVMDYLQFDLGTGDDRNLWRLEIGPLKQAIRTIARRKSLETGSVNVEGLVFFRNNTLGIPTPREATPIGLVAKLVFGLGPVGLIEFPVVADSQRFYARNFPDHDCDHLTALAPFSPEGLLERVQLFRSFLRMVSNYEQNGRTTLVDLLILLLFQAVRERGLPLSGASQLAQVLAERGGSGTWSLEYLIEQLQSRLEPNDFLESLRDPAVRASVYKLRGTSRSHKRLPGEIREAVDVLSNWLKAEVAREQGGGY